MYETQGLQRAVDCGEKLARPLTPMENLQMQKRALEEHLGNVNAAIQALEDHPEVTKVLELLAKART